jgi:hypothetical protein
VKIFSNDSKGSFHVNKNLGLEEAGCEWILSLDADECVDGELAVEIKRVLSGDTGSGMLGYYVNRKNYFLGEWIRGCGWYPDCIIRLFRKGATCWPIEIHDVPDIADKSKVGFLKGHLEHSSYRSMDQYMQKFSQYTTRLAFEQWDRGKRVSALTFPLYFMIRPLYWFTKKYFFQKGFADGFRGFFISSSSAFTIFFMYTKLWALQQRNPDGKQQ